MIIFPVLTLENEGKQWSLLSALIIIVIAYKDQLYSRFFKSVNTNHDNYLLTLKCTEAMRHMLLAMNNLENILAEESRFSDKCFIILDGTFEERLSGYLAQYLCQRGSSGSRH